MNKDISNNITEVENVEKSGFFVEELKEKKKNSNNNTGSYVSSSVSNKTKIRDSYHENESENDGGQTDTKKNASSGIQGLSYDDSLSVIGGGDSQIRDANKLVKNEEIIAQSNSSLKNDLITLIDYQTVSNNEELKDGRVEKAVSDTDILNNVGDEARTDTNNPKLSLNDIKSNQEKSSFVSSIEEVSYEELSFEGDEISFIDKLKLEKIPNCNFEIFKNDSRVIDDHEYFIDKKEFPVDIGLFFGVNTAKNFYGASTRFYPDLSNELNKSYQSALGFSGSLNLSYELNNKYYVESGIDVHYIRSLFDIKQESNVIVSYGDQLIGFDVDPISGDTSNMVYQEHFAPGLSTRTVLNHNKLTSYSIPLMVGRKYQTETFAIGASAGPVISLYKKQSGKLLGSENVIMAYNNDNNGRILYNEASLGIRISPFIEKSLNENFKIRLRSQIDIKSHKQLKFHNLKQTDTMYNIQLGLIYSW